MTTIIEVRSDKHRYTTLETRNCEECGVPYQAIPCKPNRFCSRKCSGLARKRGRIEPRPWTTEEIDLLESLLNKLSDRELANELERSINQVRHMKRRLREGSAYIDRKFWTDDEIDIVRRTSSLTAHQVAMKLDRRTADAVEHLRRRLRITEGINFGDNDKDPFEVGTRRLLAKTCIGCGLLLDASWYYVNKTTSAKGKRWRSRCARCSETKSEHRTTTRKTQNANFHYRLNAITRDRASRHREPWTDADHEILKQSSLTRFEKAILLGRTYLATATILTKNGYTSRVVKGDPMHGVWVIENPNETAA